jgi:hypothetical protein
MKICYVLLFITCLVGCTKAKNNNSASLFLKEAALFSPPPTEPERPVADAEMIKVVPDDAVPPDDLSVLAKLTHATNKIVKEGRVTVRTNHIAISKKRLDTIVSRLNSYYETENFSNTSDRISYDLRIRVPAQYFDALIQRVEMGDGDITDKNINARNRSEEYEDVAMRLSTKRQFLNRYHQLVAKAGNVKDLLAIQEKIRALQEEIEAAEGRLQYIDHQVSYATLSVNLYENRPFVQGDDSFVKKAGNRFADGWQSITDSVLMLVGSWPLVVVVILLAALVRRITKSKRDKTKLHNS